VTTICQPNPKITPDPQQQNLILSQNKLTFYVLAITCIFRAAALIFVNFAPSFDFVQFCMLAQFLILFVLLCRSFHFILHISITLTSFFWCYYGLITYSDFVAYSLNLALVTPPFIYFVSRSVPIMISSAVLQAFILHFIYRKKITDLFVD